MIESLDDTPRAAGAYFTTKVIFHGNSHLRNTYAGVFLFLQKYIYSGLISGAVKE